LNQKRSKVDQGLKSRRFLSSFQWKLERNNSI